jgi:hypothetical protein
VAEFELVFAELRFKLYMTHMMYAVVPDFNLFSRKPCGEKALWYLCHGFFSPKRFQADHHHIVHTELFHSIANELNSTKQLCEQWILV